MNALKSVARTQRVNKSSFIFLMMGPWIVIRILYPDRNPDHPQNVIDCSLKAHHFHVNPTDRQIEWQTSQQDQKHNLRDEGN